MLLFTIFTIVMYFPCISDKFNFNFTIGIRILHLWRYVPRDQQFNTSAWNNNSPIEGITLIEHALVLQLV